jgi:UDP-N-acetylmuramate dehydrogenase
MTDFLTQVYALGLPVDVDRILLQEPLSRYSTFRVGGPADYLLDVSSETELLAILSLARACDIPVTIIGNGSNLLVSDSGVRGLVLRLSSSYNAVHLDPPFVFAQAGASLSSLSSLTIKSGLAGMAEISGIPGTIGGAVYMNAGAFGQEIGNLFFSCRVYDPRTQEILTLTREEVTFSYRHSSLSDAGYVILEVTLRLNTGDPNTLARRAREIANSRQESQPIEAFSAGSTFKRPKGAFAAELIDRCGLKGMCVGDAQVSPKHAGFIVNRGHASATEIFRLMQAVHRRVLEQTGFSLEPEVHFLGDFPPFYD